MQKILVAGPTFPDVIERLKQYFEVDWNQGDVPGEVVGQDRLDRLAANPAHPVRLIAGMLKFRYSIHKGQSCRSITDNQCGQTQLLT